MNHISTPGFLLAAIVSASLISFSANGDDLSPSYGSVELLRDSWGVPHVFAETDPGAMINADHEQYLFQETGLVRESWTPEDCLLSWWHLAQFFSKNGLRDWPHLTPKAPPPGRVGRVRIDDDAAVVRREDVSEQWVAEVNAWVMGGKTTTTGASVLVSDPQTPVWNPSMLYEFHVSGATLNVRGVGVAASSSRFATFGDWAQGQLHPAPLSREAVDRLALSLETLLDSTPSPRQLPTTQHASPIPQSRR